MRRSGLWRQGVSGIGFENVMSMMWFACPNIHSRKYEYFKKSAWEAFRSYLLKSHASDIPIISYKLPFQNIGWLFDLSFPGSF